MEEEQKRLETLTMDELYEIAEEKVIPDYERIKSKRKLILTILANTTPIQPRKSK